MVAGEKVAENWLNTSVCFALSLNASLNHFRNRVPAARGLRVDKEQKKGLCTVHQNWPIRYAVQGVVVDDATILEESGRSTRARRSAG